MLTYWSFVLIGMHAGMHLGILSSKLKNKAVKVIAFVLMCSVTVCGFWLFIKANIFAVAHIIFIMVFQYLRLPKPKEKKLLPKAYLQKKRNVWKRSGLPKLMPWSRKSMSWSAVAIR